MLGLLNALARQQGRYRLLLFENASSPVPVKCDNVQRMRLRNGRYSLAGQAELAWHLARQRVDLVHCPFYVAPMAATCPVVVTFYDLIAFRFCTYGAVKRALIKAGYKAGVRKAAGIVVCSKRTAYDCAEILGADLERTRVAYAGRSQEFSIHSKPDEVDDLQRQYGVRRPYILLLGSKHWRTKGLGLALKALARCKESHDFQIVWVGAEEALNEDPDAKGAEVSEVLKCGFVPNSDLARLYRQAHAFLLPSLYEGFGMPLLEAMSCGCPVVCSDGGSLPEVAGSGAVVVPRDLSRMADAVSAFLVDDNLRQEQKGRALARAQEFSWDHSVEIVLRLYEDILGLSLGALSQEPANQPGGNHDVSYVAY